MSTLAKLIVQIGANSAEFEQEITKVSKQLKAFQKETKGLEPVMDGIGRALKVVGIAAVAAFAAGGTAAFASGKVIEQYRLSLTTLMGSSKAAGEAVANALALAGKTPFTDDQLLAATIALTKFGQSAQSVLPQVANMAAATNKDVTEAAEAFGAFLQGRVKALASYGITKAAVLAEGAATEQGIQITNQKGQIVNEQAYSKALLSLMDKRFKDGALLQSNSLNGLVIRVKDAMEDALRTVAGFASDGTIRVGSFFDLFKKGVTEVIAKIEEWQASGQLQEWADKVGKALAAFFTGAKVVFNWLGNIATWIADNWTAITAVLGAVLGAFLAFKVVTGIVSGITIALGALKAILVVTNGVLALTPLGAIMIAVAALTAVVILATTAWKRFKESMTLTADASATNIEIYKKQLEAFDALTANGIALRKQDGASVKVLADYEAARAKERVPLEKKVYDEIAAVRGAAYNKQAQAEIDAADRIAAAEKQQRDAKTAADKAAADVALAAAKTNAEKVAKVSSDLGDKIYKLTHTAVQNQIYDLEKEVAAMIAGGAKKLDAEKYYALASKKIYADAAEAKATAEKEAADKAAKAWDDANAKQIQDVKDTYDAYIDALGDYADKQKDVQGALTQAIIDNYSTQEDAAVSALESERDTAIDTINDQIDARNRQLETTLNNISIEKDAALGIFDTQIQALQDAHAATERAERVAGLRADVASATTAEERLKTQKALDKELADEAYSDQLEGLRKQRAAASDFWDAQTKAAQTVAASDLQVLKDQVTATQDSYDSRITSVKAYYDNLKPHRNADAEAEKLLANKTQGEIMAMLQGRLGEWKALGTQIGDSVYAGLERAIDALNTLIGTTIPVAPVTGGGGGGRAMIAHAAGGYFTTPHIAAIAEREPEFVVPQSQAAAFAARMGNMPVNVTYNINGASDIPAIRLELQHHDKELLGMLRGGRW